MQVYIIYIYACDVTISHIYFGVRTAVTERIHSVTNKKKRSKKEEDYISFEIESVYMNARVFDPEYSIVQCPQRSGIVLLEYMG